MPEPFDPYRDALVVETETQWPEAVAHVPADQRDQIARQLHADPRQAPQLDYVRLHAGFCRRITVTPEDLKRLEAGGRP